jgi:hypothetical protein
MGQNTVENLRPLGVPWVPVTRQQMLDELARLDTLPPGPHSCPAPARVPLQGTPWTCPECGKRWLAKRPGWRPDPKWKPKT